MLALAVRPPLRCAAATHTGQWVWVYSCMPSDIDTSLSYVVLRVQQVCPARIVCGCAVCEDIANVAEQCVSQWS